MNDEGVNDRAALRNYFYRVQQLRAVVEPFLEQVRSAVGVWTQQADGERRLSPLAQGNQADLRLLGSQSSGDAHPFLIARRWHANVRDHDVGVFAFDGLPQ